LHLILFDTSPLQVHTHANFCMRMFTAAIKGLARARMQMHAIVCIRLLDTYLGDTGIKVTHGAEPTQTERRMSFRVPSFRAYLLMASVIRNRRRRHATGQLAGFSPAPSGIETA